MRTRAGRFVPHGERKVIVGYNVGVTPRAPGRNSRFGRAAYRMRTIGAHAGPITREPDGDGDYVSVTIRAKVVLGFVGSQAHSDASRSISATTACRWA